MHLTQLLLNTDLRKVSHVHPPAVKAIVHMHQKSNLGADRELPNLDTEQQLCLQFGQPQLPDGINRADSLSLKGTHVLQITSSEDVSKPSKGIGTSSHRCNTWLHKSTVHSITKCDGFTAQRNRL